MAISVPFYSQRDPRWSSKKLGFSQLTIGSHGCTITCLAMLVGETPDVVNEKLKKVRAFSGALLIWSGVRLAYPQLNFIKRAYNYNNLEVSFHIYIKKVPVLVEVNGAKIGAPRHWVLFIGDKKAHDPWTGKLISTAFYPLTGYALFNKN